MIKNQEESIHTGCPVFWLIGFGGLTTSTSCGGCITSAYRSDWTYAASGPSIYQKQQKSLNKILILTFQQVNIFVTTAKLFFKKCNTTENFL